MKVLGTDLNLGNIWKIIYFYSQTICSKALKVFKSVGGEIKNKIGVQIYQNAL